MLSICTVVTDSIVKTYLDKFLDSVAAHLKLVREVIVVNCEHGGGLASEYKIRDDIVVKRYNYHIEDRPYQHPLGLHYALDNATQDYILFSDPDLYFYTAVDEVYKNLMDKYNLFIVGISHHSSLGMTMKFFPCVQSCLVKRSTLPGPDFLKGKLKKRNMLAPGHLFADDAEEREETFPLLDGKYLVHGPIPGLWDKFPEPNPNFSCDTGCNLCLYCNEIGGRWLSFQTLDIHNYTTKIYRNNFKLKDNLGNTKLLYHETNGCHHSAGVL